MLYLVLNTMDYAMDLKKSINLYKIKRLWKKILLLKSKKNKM